MVANVQKQLAAPSLEIDFAEVQNFYLFVIGGVILLWIES